MVTLGRERWNDYFDLNLILRKAEQSLNAPTVHITDTVAPKSAGGIHDYYSNGDYWWPNPATSDGMPYIRRDGESNPDNFSQHRLILREMRTHVAQLASAYKIYKKEEFAQKAVLFLKEFFLDESTRMNPHLLYAQAIPGVSPGRGIGIIDTLHLIDVPLAIRALQASPHMTDEILAGLEQWFADYLHWMSHHENGIEEMNENNNHSVCWFVQAATFALFTNHAEMLDFCRVQFKERLIPDQMDLDGSFPRELARTKPYGYSIFMLDNMITLCHILSTPHVNLWTFELPDGRGIKKGIEFLLPYMIEKESWPYAHDVESYESWPVGISSLLFTGLAYDSVPSLHLWRTLEQDPQVGEVRRNMAIRQPLLWL
ncbi:alginate lyase family protein [Paenibacillus sp. 1_12]|uniref:alginate lyase family protein n=1 Tax=Paenibacillus sp. 1_12 TaxID=1566278 RepID=UPI000B89DCE7|nr:alginate lyase family protein [Paenibacillus sp. 1_12]